MKPLLASLFAAPPVMLLTLPSLAGNVSSSWQSATGGDWRTGSAWVNTPAVSSYPANGGTMAFDVNITAAGQPYSIALPTSLSLDSVTLNSPDATVQHTFGTVRVVNGMNLQAGSWQMSGSTLINTTINQTGSGGLRFGVTTSKLDHCTVNGSLDFPATNAHVMLLNGTTFTGNVTMGGNYTTLALKGTQTLDGPRTVALNGNSSQLSAEGAGSVLTLGPALLVRGRGMVTTNYLTNDGSTASVINNGTLRGDVPALPLTVDADVFTNNGTAEAAGGELVLKSPQWTNTATGILRAAGTGSRLRLDGAWTNAGSLQLNGGRLELAGQFSTDGLGLAGWTRSGGTVEVPGDWNNTARTMTFTAATGDFVLKGGSITGGTLIPQGARLAFSQQGGELTGVAIQGGLQLDKLQDRVLLRSGSDFTADTSLTGNYALLSFAGGTVAGGKSILLDATGAALSTEGVDSVLSLSGGLTVHGRGTLKAGAILTSTNARIVNSGRISADISGQTLSVEPPLFENKGTAEAINGGTLTLKSPVWVNTGTLRAVNSKLRLEGIWDNNGAVELNNGTLELAGTFNTADLNLGAWSRTGGSVEITGAWNNVNSTLDLTPATGSFLLRDGILSGGTVTQSGGARLMFHSAGGELRGVTVTGDLVLDKTSDRVLLRDGSVFTGNAQLTGNYSALGFGGNNVLTGTRSLNLDANGTSVSVEGPDGQLTLGSGITLRGRGQLKAGTFLTSPNAAVRNQGRISADSSANNLTVETPLFTNEGIAEAVNNSTLLLRSASWSSSAAATIRATGANLTFQGTWSNAGAITLTNSKLRLDGTFSTPGLGLAGWSRTGGTVELAGDLNNTNHTLTLTPGTGDFRLVGGLVTGGTVKAGAQRIIFTSTGGTLDNLLWQGDLRVEEMGAWTYLTGGTTFTGNAYLTGNSTRLSIAGSRTFAGPREIQLTGSAAAVSLEGNDVTLTIEPGFTVHGRGFLTNSRIVTSSNARIINRGVISADIAGQTLKVENALTQESSGILEARTGTLELPAGYLQTTGTLRAAGGILQVNGSGATSTIVLNGGRLEGSGQVKPVISSLPLSVLAADAVIAPGSHSAGSLAIRGDLIATGATQFQFDLDTGATAAGFAALTEAGNQAFAPAGFLAVRLGTGLAAALKATDTITLLQSSQALAGGVFNNAPSGSRITALDGSGSFQINYGAGSTFGADRVVLSHWQSTPPAGFAAWVATFGLTGENAAATADPDQDSLANVLEYAFGLSPVQAGGLSFLPVAGFNAQGQTTLTFSLPGALPQDVICEIESSADLTPASWQVLASRTGGGTWSGPVSGSPQNDRVLTVFTDTGAPAGAVRRFLRLRVRLAP